MHTSFHKTTTKLAFLVFYIFAISQTIKAESLAVNLDTTYGFINYSSNRLIYPKSHKNMHSFYSKMNQLLLHHDTTISIVHIGGSHVQADCFTHYFRQMICNMGDSLSASRGLIFPFHAAHTNGPNNYCTQYEGTWVGNRNSKPSDGQPLGITGWSIATDDSLASISVRINPTINNDTVWLFNQITLLGASYNNQLIPLLIVNNDTLAPDFVAHHEAYKYHWKKPTYEAKVIFMPFDYYFINYKIKKKLYHTINHSLNYSPQEKYPILSKDTILHTTTTNSWNHKFNLRGFICENTTKKGFTVNSLGANGASVPSWLRCYEFSEELKLIKPDLVIMGIGINDAYCKYGKFKPEEFKNNYRKLINRIQKVNPKVSILFLTNNDSYYRASKRSKRICNKNGALVQQAFLELAEEYNTAVWDMYDVMGGYKSMSQWEKAKLARRDKIHFTREGYRYLAHLFYQAFIKDYIHFFETQNTTIYKPSIPDNNL